jgi:hypothetical protein
MRRDGGSLPVPASRPDAGHQGDMGSVWVRVDAGGPGQWTESGHPGFARVSGVISHSTKVANDANASRTPAASSIHAGQHRAEPGAERVPSELADHRPEMPTKLKPLRLCRVRR